MIKAVIFDMFETLITHYKCPLYFSEQMAEDIGVDKERFRQVWSPTERDRTVGKIRFEDVIVRIMKENGCYSEKQLERVVLKRTETKKECFRQLDPEIVPMLEKLKQKKMKIGLISNCFSEEAAVIRQSPLAGYFDGMYLSFELGVGKPDPEIFEKCVTGLGVSPCECLYVGDGGSGELQAAAKAGMKAVQAGWYLRENGFFDEYRDERFELLKNPLRVLDILASD